MNLVMGAKTPKLTTMKRLLPFFLLFLSSASMAESGSYRVEVIIFRNLAVTAEAAEVETLRSFSAFPALEKPLLPLLQPLGNALEQVDTADEPTQAAAPALEPNQATAESRRFDLPDDLRVVNEKSPVVDAAWRRLQGSENYRPLLFAAWEQNRTDYYPPMRIHDQQLIATQLRAPARLMVADLTAPDPLAAYRSAFYRLDGSVQLRRSRFLHLHLDLEYRETAPGQAMANPLAPAAGKYQVFQIRQNRQVRTGQMQYFDTPQFGVLVLVTATQPG
jgi:hypothetical protein